MGLFGSGKRDTRHERIEEQITALAAQLNSLQMIVFEVMQAIEPGRKETVLSKLRSFLLYFGTVKPPTYVPERLAQPYRDELSRVMQLYIETIAKG